MQIEKTKTKLFHVVEYNLSNYCNRNCSFCPSGPRENKEYLDFQVFKKSIEDIRSIKEDFDGVICISGFSEPLLHPQLVLMIQTAKQLLPNCFIELITNNDFMTYEMLQNVFDAGVGLLKVSAYSQSHLDKINEFYGPVENKYNMIVRTRFIDGDTHWTNVAGALTDYEELNIERTCYYPFYLMLINYNGNVGFCCNNYAEKYIIGNIKDSHIQDLWYSDRLLKIRKMLLQNKRDIKPCSTCNVIGTLTGEEKFNLWK